jgi:hypothetical protein
MAEADKYANHDEPVWRARANFLLQVDLSQHGMASGSYEQLWARTDDRATFEVCCLPFFTYGIALGDMIAWDNSDRRVVVVRRSGRRLLRCAFADLDDAFAYHETFHASIAATGALVEFRGGGLVAVDIDSDERLNAVLEVVRPLHESGRVMWEWGDR